MRKIIPGIQIFILSGLILFSFSCTPQSCFEETESFLKASFYDDVTKKILAPDSLTMYGLNMETNKLYNKTSKVQPALIPLNASAGNCIYIIRINGITDTIEFNYSSFPHLVSKECGYTFYHYLDTDRIFTKNAIHDIIISSRSITTINVENIQIFY
ncbi:MAG: DUF6452 family protein [Bacteroidia bacterium]|nr:DUF6452 family protein [Bacteroidia bacterium]